MRFRNGRRAMAILASIASLLSWAQAVELQGPYLGQDLPGMTPQRFAPDVVSLPHRFDFSGSFTPEGNEFYFTYSNPDWSGNSVMVSRQENGVWTPPAVVPFSGWDVDWTVFLSPDGQRLFFSSGRPIQSWRLNVWMCQREGTAWSAPVKLDLNSDLSDYAGTCTADGVLYFASVRDGSGAIYRSAPDAGGYREVEKLPYPVNSGLDINPYIAPDESYLLFASDRTGNRDLYVSYRNADDSWQEPVNLGAPINSGDADGNPFMSPDGRILFFARDTGLESSPREIDIYWVDARAALPDPDGPVANLSTNQHFGSVQCAINYAHAGDVIQIAPDIYAENIALDKDVTLESVDPNDPYYIGGTVIQGQADRPVVALNGNSEACQLAGLTLRAGSVGVLGIATNATLRNCRVIDNAAHGLELSEASRPHLVNCLITGNGQIGITMHTKTGRYVIHCEPVIEHCVIVDNGISNLEGGEPVVVNSVIQ